MERVAALAKHDMSMIVTLLMEIKMTVGNIERRLQSLEAEKKEVFTDNKVCFNRINDAASLNLFLEQLRGKEEDYVSEIYIKKNIYTEA